jgi:hypothetical protein
LIAIAQVSAGYRDLSEFHNPRLKMVRRNSGWLWITAALFIEHSSEI